MGQSLGLCSIGFWEGNEIPYKGNLLVDDESEFSLALGDGRWDHREDGGDDRFRLGCNAACRVTGDEWPFAATA